MTEPNDPTPLSAAPAAEALLTVTELANALRCSPSWVYVAARESRIPVVRVGSLKRFELAAVLSVLRGVP